MTCPTCLTDSVAAPTSSDASREPVSGSPVCVSLSSYMGVPSRWKAKRAKAAPLLSVCRLPRGWEPRLCHVNSAGRDADEHIDEQSGGSRNGGHFVSAIRPSGATSGLSIGIDITRPGEFRREQNWIGASAINTAVYGCACID